MNSIFGLAYKIAKWKRDALGVSVTEAANRKTPITVNKSHSRLFALIIGINAYPKLKPLAGAVSDANEVELFLTADLQVPASQIKKLTESQATRHAIIQAFRRLRDDPRIQRDDPILIFYAGHGGLGKASPEWKQRYGYDEVQVIFPYDYNVATGGPGKVVSCIPDRTIGALLNDLAAGKGNNITVIFDACHSASANRGESSDAAVPGLIARSADVPVDIPNDIDSDIIPTHPVECTKHSGTRARAIRHAGLPLYSNQASHAYFSACGSQEKAWEEGGRGIFTSALLKCIRANGMDKVSYSELIMSLPLLPKQSPHCYGTYKTRILFDSRVPSRRVTFIPVIQERDALTLQAGAASGVALGSVWELHAEPMEDSNALCLLQAQSLGVSSTALSLIDAKRSSIVSRLAESGAGRLYARQIRSGTGQELRVYFSPDAMRLELPPGKGNTNQLKDHEIGYVVHPARDGADLIVEVSGAGANREVIYTLCDSQVQKYGLATLRKRTRVRRDEVERVLFAAARWHWHLRRTNPSARSASVVTLEMVKLGVSYGDSMIYTTGPLEDLNKTGVVDLEARVEEQYGIRLSSRVPTGVYVHMFYFDTTNFSIVPMFEHGQANGRADPDIPACGQFMIGDESDGGAPLSFQLDGDETLDVGYIKVFWSTDPLELGAMTQGSPFGLPDPDEEAARKVGIRDRVVPKEWGTGLLELVQRAPKGL